MKNLVFLLEEESAKELIENLMPRIFPSLSFKCIAFEGKQDLERNIPLKLRGYRIPETKFIIMRDQDNSDCIPLKKYLKNLCEKANKSEALIRIACRELEAWYFGDLQSVETSLKISNIAHYSRKKRYRSPDNIVNPKEELIKITKGKYHQVSCSSEIGKHINIDNNTSKSFQVFIKGLKELLEIENI